MPSKSTPLTVGHLEQRKIPAAVLPFTLVQLQPRLRKNAFALRLGKAKQQVGG
jgi:hypothetical protein